MDDLDLPDDLPLIDVPKELVWDYRETPMDPMWRLERVASWFPVKGRDRKTVAALYRVRHLLKLPPETFDLIELYEEKWREREEERCRGMVSRDHIPLDAPMPLLGSVVDELPLPGRVHSRTELSADLADGRVRAGFVRHEFERTCPAPAHTFGLGVDSLRDMLANKLAAVLDRNAAKDFADILLLLRQPGLTLDQGMVDCEKKFGWPGLPVVLQQAFMRGTRLTMWPELDPPLSLEEARVELRALAASLIRLDEE